MLHVLRHGSKRSDTMLFNNLVSQSGGGTEPTLTKIHVDPGQSAKYLIPDSTTLIWYVGNANGPSCAMYKRTKDGFVPVEAYLSWTMTITLSSDLLTFTSKGSDSYYQIDGTFAYL